MTWTTLNLSKLFLIIEGEEFSRWYHNGVTILYDYTKGTGTETKLKFTVFYRWAGDSSWRTRDNLNSSKERTEVEQYEIRNSAKGFITNPTLQGMDGIKFVVEFVDNSGTIGTLRVAPNNYKLVGGK